MGWLEHPLVQSMVCAWGFSFWPVAQRLLGVPVGWAMILLAVVQFPATWLLFKLAPAMPSPKGLALFALLGAVPNGIAMLSFGHLLRREGDVMTRWVPIMDVAMPIIAIIGGVFLLGEVMTMRKAFGIAAACFSIYLLSTS